MVKFVFSHSKLKKQPFFDASFKIQWNQGPPCPPSDAHACDSYTSGCQTAGPRTGTGKHRFFSGTQTT